MEWEFTPVQEQLDAYWVRMEAKNQDTEEFPTEGPLRKLLLISMKPGKAVLMFRCPRTKINQHEYIHEKGRVHMRMGTFLSHMAIFGLTTTG